MEGAYDQQKQSAGAFAMTLWLGIGAYLFAVNDKASFFSWQGAVYFVGGMFASSLLIGTVVYGIQRSISKILISAFSSPTSGFVTFVQTIGIVLMVGEAIAIYFIADWVIDEYLFPA